MSDCRNKGRNISQSHVSNICGGGKLIIYSLTFWVTYLLSSTRVIMWYGMNIHELCLCVLGNNEKVGSILVFCHVYLRIAAQMGN